MEVLRSGGSDVYGAVLLMDSVRKPRIASAPVASSAPEGSCALFIFRARIQVCGRLAVSDLSRTRDQLGNSVRIIAVDNVARGQYIVGVTYGIQPWLKMSVDFGRSWEILGDGKLRFGCRKINVRRLGQRLVLLTRGSTPRSDLEKALTG